MLSTVNQSKRMDVENVHKSKTNLHTVNLSKTMNVKHYLPDTDNVFRTLLTSQIQCIRRTVKQTNSDADRKISLIIVFA